MFGAGPLTLPSLSGIFILIAVAYGVAFLSIVIRKAFRAGMDGSHEAVEQALHLHVGASGGAAVRAAGGDAPGLRHRAAAGDVGPLNAVEAAVVASMREALMQQAQSGAVFDARGVCPEVGLQKVVSSQV